MSDLPAWGNLTATTALIGVVVYLITSGLPKMIEIFVNETRRERDEFKDVLQKQRDDFREEIDHHRDHGKALADAGYRSFDQLSSKIDKLVDKLDCANQQKKS